jgi:hypothetical protein
MVLGQPASGCPSRRHSSTQESEQSFFNTIYIWPKMLSGLLALIAIWALLKARTAKQAVPLVGGEQPTAAPAPLRVPGRTAPTDRDTNAARRASSATIVVRVGPLQYSKPMRSGLKAGSLAAPLQLHRGPNEAAGVHCPC